MFTVLAAVTVEFQTATSPLVGAVPLVQLAPALRSVVLLALMTSAASACPQAASRRHAAARQAVTIRARSSRSMGTPSRVRRLVGPTRWLLATAGQRECTVL